MKDLSKVRENLKTLMEMKAAKDKDSMTDRVHAVVQPYNSRIMKFLTDLAYDLIKEGATDAEITAILEGQIKKLEDLN